MPCSTLVTQAGENPRGRDRGSSISRRRVSSRLASISGARLSLGVLGGRPSRAGPLHGGAGAGAAEPRVSGAVLHGAETVTRGPQPGHVGGAVQVLREDAFALVVRHSRCRVARRVRERPGRLPTSPPREDLRAQRGTSSPSAGRRCAPRRPIGCAGPDPGPRASPPGPGRWAAHRPSRWPASLEKAQAPLED